MYRELVLSETPCLILNNAHVIEHQMSWIDWRTTVLVAFPIYMFMDTVENYGQRLFKYAIKIIDIRSMQLM